MLPIILILGSPNSPSGQLFATAKARLDYCITIHHQGQKILLTGGHGPHFNTAPQPHAYYCRQYLLRRGFDLQDFMTFALSQNTVDDAVKAKAILDLQANKSIVVITSDYHLDRVKIIFPQILRDYTIDFVGVKTKMITAKIKALIAHERKAINEIQRNGLYW